MLQRSDEWFEARKGRFTASNISRLLGKESLKKTKDSIDTFAFEKAVESVYGVETDQIVSFDMQRGVDLEPYAFAKFKELKSLEFLEVVEVGFYKFGKHAGASPDGVVSNNSNLEIKCPKRNKFFKLVANGISEIDSKYIAQMQMQMLSIGADQTYFFNYLVENGVEYWHEIIVPRDEKMISLIEERVKIGAKIKLDYIEKLNKNKQF